MYIWKFYSESIICELGKTKEIGFPEFTEN